MFVYLNVRIMLIKPDYIESSVKKSKRTNKNELNSVQVYNLKLYEPLALLLKG